MNEHQWNEFIAAIRVLGGFLITLLFLLLLLMLIGFIRLAHPQERPVSITKVGSTCPPGYVPSALLCNPDRGAGIAKVRGLGPCPIGWLTAGDYCLATSGARRP